MTAPLQQLKDLVDPVKMREEFEASVHETCFKGHTREFALLTMRGGNYGKKDDSNWWNDRFIFWQASRAALIPIIEQMEANMRNDHTHICIKCGHEYTPVSGASEDCPKCGCNGEAS